MPIVTTIIALALAALLPGAWLVMLALGNFGFTEFGLIDCLPAGMILVLLINGSGS